MKKYLILLISIILLSSLSAQVTTVPAFIEKGYKGEVTIVFNPNEGNAGMKNATKCYAHTGVTINGQSWQHAPTWRDGKHQMTKNADGNWELKITPDINTYYGCAATDIVTQLCFVFNDGPNGSLEGKTSTGGDIFVDLIDPGLTAKITSPIGSTLVGQGETVNIVGESSQTAELSLSVNGTQVTSVNGVKVQYQLNCNTQGDYNIVLTAKTAEETTTDELSIVVLAPTITQSRPEGIDMGIYINPTDPTKVTLSTYAASKTDPAKAVFVVGDFNNWALNSDYQMKQDGNYFWLEIDNLDPEEEYAFQYAVIRADGVMKRISDLYSTKLLHPDDRYEPKQHNPTLRDYPAQGDGYVTVIQTQKPEFQWSDATLNFRRPNKNNLVIYELWVYDYTPDRSFAGLMERLDYIQNLGVNAIELMPVCEFDGNYNWGYSPNHYFAVDKAYGSEDEFKTLIDECHKRGIAVIMDMVFNHATGLNPMNKIYPYGNDLQYNPWFCTQVPHDDNVYEHWNHDFEPARKMFTRALNYWIEEFHVDGYRMDLSHGLCGCGTPSAYDQKLLMNNLKHYYENGVLAAADIAKNGEPFFILEHWGHNMGTQRPQLISQGMLCWDNTNNAYSQTAMGWLKDGDSFTNANRDGYVTYCESHDEERNQYKAITWGIDAIKNNFETRIQRVSLNTAFNVLLNGPHMLWQYQEVGYDYSINSTKGSSTISDGNRTSTKERPEAHGYFLNGPRMEQYQRVAQIIRLRTEIMPSLFAGDPQKVSVGAGAKLRTILWDNGTDGVYVVGNFSPTEIIDATMPSGLWFDYFKQWDLSTNGTITLQPGELRIFTSRKVELPQVPNFYDINTGVTTITPTTQGNARKVLQNGILRIILPDGRQYDAMGNMISNN